MRLTPEVVARSQSHLNPLKERELDLRGLQIPLIENLASHQGTYDVLNLTDNSLISLGNIPLAPRLRTIHAALNNISSISPSFPNSVPQLETLVLTSNSLSTLSSLLPLATLSSLKHLSLRGNPVRSESYYREWVIWKLAKGNLRTLDFQRIKDSERAQAKLLFEDPETKLPTKSALSLTSESISSTPGGGGLLKSSIPSGLISGSGSVSINGGGKGRLMTPAEKSKVREAIVGAKSVEEMRRLEKMLGEGRVPEGGLGVAGAGAGGDVEMET